jgi:hypothetical protein
MVPTVAKRGRRARKDGKVRLLNVEVAVPLLDVLEAYRKRSRYSKRVIVEFALEAYLKSVGALPPNEPIGGRKP